MCQKFTPEQLKNMDMETFLSRKGKKNFLPFAQKSKVLFPGRPDCLRLIDGKPL